MSETVTPEYVRTRWSERSDVYDHVITHGDDVYHDLHRLADAIEDAQAEVENLRAERDKALERAEKAEAELEVETYNHQVTAEDLENAHQRIGHLAGKNWRLREEISERIVTLEGRKTTLMDNRAGDQALQRLNDELAFLRALSTTEPSETGEEQSYLSRVRKAAYRVDDAFNPAGGEIDMPERLGGKHLFDMLTDLHDVIHDVEPQDEQPEVAYITHRYTREPFTLEPEPDTTEQWEDRDMNIRKRLVELRDRFLREMDQCADEGLGDSALFAAQDADFIDAILADLPEDALSFEAFRVANVQRCEQEFFPIENWNLLEWAGAMCGEAGEAANVAKKIVRDKYKKASTEDLKHEIGGTVAYLDLLATRAGLRLEDCATAAFNDVSERIGAGIRLPVAGHSLSQPNDAEPDTTEQDGTYTSAQE